MIPVTIDGCKNRGSGFQPQFTLGRGRSRRPAEEHDIPCMLRGRRETPLPERVTPRKTQVPR